MKVDIRLVLTVGVIIGGAIYGYGKFQEKVEKTETIVAQNTERLYTNDMLDAVQTTLIETTTKTLERNTKLIDQIEARF